MDFTARKEVTALLIYETERSEQLEYLYCQRDHDFNFPAHLHHSYE